MELLRFTTAGSVDVGKSTLIGRLLYDSKAIFEDQLEAIKRASIQKGEERVNLALLTDGLRAEREQGITIDVAYRYFATPKRKFIIADAPGHIQYTRNMVTGASTANIAIILVDARNGILEQTVRHAYIASLLRIRHLVVCVNKMDLTNWSEKVFSDIQASFEDVSAKLDIQDVRFIPISALYGDNVVERSKNMDWYDGPSLMYYLENVQIRSDINYVDFRFPVQYIVRPQSDPFNDYRGYAGRIASGIISKGDRVIILPSGLKSTVKSIDTLNEIPDSAFAPQSVVLVLEDDIDISRGDLIVKDNNLPEVSQDIELMVCWLGEKPMAMNGRYWVRHTTRDARCIIKDLIYKIDNNTLDRNGTDKSLSFNEIARIRIRTTKPLFYDSYNRNRITGSLILIDEGNYNTVGGGMIV